MADDSYLKKSQTRNGVVPVPLGSRGPRSLYLRRHGDNFGFRIRHFILYPPDSVAGDSRNTIGSLQEPMETIFVIELSEHAREAGLQLGDKLIAVNNIPVTDISYRQVVGLIYRSQEYLHLLVVPKEEDTIQKFFSEAAYNPVSNQATAEPAFNPRPFHQKNVGRSGDFPKHSSHKSLDNNFAENKVFNRNKNHLEQRSADDLLHSQTQENIYCNPNAKTFSEGYLDPSKPNDVYYRSKAQPQVPYNKKMGRRASEGNMLSDHDIYESITGHPTNKMGTTTKATVESNYQLSLDDCRRDSNASLTSSVAESSKGSLSSFNSISTLTGHETDDSLIINRIRRNVQQKEEFLRRSSNPFEKPITQKEFYSRPNRLEKPIWPPGEVKKPPLQQKPAHPNFQKIKNEIEMEHNKMYMQQLAQKENIEVVDSQSLPLEYGDKKNCLPQLQMVSKRTKLFETGKPLPEDVEESIQIDRTNFHKSELARLSAVHANPNVNCRAREFENMVDGVKKEEATNKIIGISEKGNRDSQLLENEDGSNVTSMSGNVLTLVGGKNLHCPPPTDYNGLTAVNIDKPAVIRRTKNINIDDEERAMRRESYLKATEGGRVNFDVDYKDYESMSRLLKSPINANERVASNGSLEKSAIHPTVQNGAEAKEEAHQRKLMEIDEKNSHSTSQKAEPQTTPATTSIQVQGAQLSPQLASKSKVPTTFRNRSPTGQSPVSKTRKSSQIPEPVFISPKIKTWRGKVAKQFKKIHGVTSPSSPTATEGSTFGVPLNYCLPSTENEYVPRIVEVCTEIVESKGLDTIGIYRVPGNNAAVTALTEEVNRNYDDLPQLDPRWNDIHVVSSLLKSFFRKMPDSLLTNAAYPSFIQADKIDDPKLRMEKIKMIIKNLPAHHYHTLKHLMLHLKKVVQHSEFNKMECRNLAIVFGPTLVRAGEENMEMMVNDMTHQCKIVESLVNYVDWFFVDEDENNLHILAPVKREDFPSMDSGNASKQALLRENICKIEALKDQKEKKEFIQNLLSAAQRKVNRKKAKHGRSFDLSKEEPSLPFKELSEDYSLQVSNVNKSVDIPTTVTEIEKMESSDKKGLWYNYNTDKDDVKKRIANFIKETESNLQRSRNIEIKFPATSSNTQVNSSAVGKPLNRILPPKTQSASNIFARTSSQDNSDFNFSNESDSFSKSKFKSDFDGSKWLGEHMISDSNVTVKCDSENFQSKFIRKGTSERNLKVFDPNLDSTASLKKEKCKNDGDTTKLSGSLESLNKLQDNIEGSDLLAEMTQLLDEKTKSLHLSKDLYFNSSDSSDTGDNKNKELPTSPKSFRNPSLHKNQFSGEKLSSACNADVKLAEVQECEKDKDEGSELSPIPDNERHLPTENKVNKKEISSVTKVKESVTRPSEKNVKRTESFKGNDRGRRYDNLSKMEKTESNNSKRRELSSSFSKRSHKEFTKLKRKNGMPERSIKRRHTVGGTKDPDKISWLDYRDQKKSSALTNSKNEKPLRISSPDLRSTRKEKLLFEVTVFGSEDMIVQFRQRVLSSRPQSYPDSYKVALESHV